ncbi:MAG: substrate-binding domain-containing protein, partial [Thermotogaceae bacterium]|nr:substrate-binding domain-containing protein [Thermotogaceae bacterium]
DIVNATVASPALTTFKIFKREMGVAAARRLLNLLMNSEPHPMKISLFTEFVRRESTTV